MRGVASILGGVCGAVIAAIVGAWIGSGLSTPRSEMALLVGVIVGMVSYRVTPSAAGERSSPIGWTGRMMIVMYSGACLRAFLWLIYPDAGEWKVLSPNNLGDMALHLAFIRWLAAAPHWWPASPILAGDPLRYPPGSDLFNALLFKVGIPVETGLIGCALGGAALTGIALWRWGGAVALAALLFNGGLGAILVFQQGWGTDLDALLQWKNLFLTLFVTQRGFLIALPIGLLLLWGWRREFFGESRPPLSLPLQALLLASLPLFSVHSALFLGVAMVGIWIVTPRSRLVLGRLALVSWPFMALSGWLVTSGAGGPSAVGSLGIAPGWTSDGSLWFWLLNFGISLPLSLLLCLLLFRRHGSPEARAFVWPASLIFVICMVVRFAPWPWDNTKLMIWSWIVVAPYLWSELIGRYPMSVRAPAALLLFGSGAMALLSGLDGRHGYTLVKRDDLDQASSLLLPVPPGTVIACAPDYNQPVLLLGHPVVCGYEGHLWSHGLDYKGRWEILNTIMNGEPGWQERAQSLGIGFIYWGAPERTRWPSSKLPWAKEQGTSLHPLMANGG